MPFKELTAKEYKKATHQGINVQARVYYQTQVSFYDKTKLKIIHNLQRSKILVIELDGRELYINYSAFTFKKNSLATRLFFRDPKYLVNITFFNAKKFIADPAPPMAATDTGAD